MSMQMGADRCGLLCRHVILGIELQEHGSMVSTLELTPIRPAWSMADEHTCLDTPVQTCPDPAPDFQNISGMERSFSS